MDMAEELPDIPVRAAIAQERIVIQDDTLPSYANGHLLSHELEALHEALLDVLHIMVSENEIDFSVKPVHDIVPISGAPHAEISEVKHDTVFRDCFVPSADEFFIHFSGIPKRAAAETNDVLVAEMRVGCEPEVVSGIKLINGLYECCFHRICNIIIICAIYLRR